MCISLPVPVLKIIAELRQAGYRALAAGEGLRDCLLGLVPQDLMVLTDAPPEIVDALFDRVLPPQESSGPLTVWESGVTVGVICQVDDPAGELRSFDFTVNALAYDPFSDLLIDPWQVCKSLCSGRGVIQGAVDPAARFQEDPSRLLGVFYLMKRFDDARLKWMVDPGTWDALVECVPLARTIPSEMVAAGLNKIIVGQRPEIYLEEMRKCGILKIIIPELAATYGIEQSDYHIKDVFGHTLLVMKEIRPELHLRWAALLHDIGKPHCISFEAESVHFYGHQVISSVMSRHILKRFKYSRDFIEKVSFLVLNHMYPTPRTRKAVRRFTIKIGLKNLGDLLELRRADIMGGKYKNIGRLEYFKKQIDAVLFELPPFSLRDLAVDGFDAMKVLGLKPGPGVGGALQFLFEKVIEEL